MSKGLTPEHIEQIRLEKEAKKEAERLALENRTLKRSNARANQVRPAIAEMRSQGRTRLHLTTAQGDHARCFEALKNDRTDTMALNIFEEVEVDENDVTISSIVITSDEGGEQ